MTTPTKSIDEFDVISGLSVTLVSRFAVIQATDPDPMSVESYLTDDSAKFVAGCVVAGRPVPTNPASTSALRVAIQQLENFYNSELVGLPMKPLTPTC